MAQLRKEVELSEALRKACLDACDSCRFVARSTALCTAKKRAELSDQCKKLDERLVEFQRTSDAKHRQRLDVMSFVKSCDLQLEATALIPPETPSQLQSLTKLIDNVKSLRTLKRFPTHQPGVSPLPTFIDQCLSSLEKCRTILTETGLNSTTWTAIPTGLIHLMTELISQQTIAEEDAALNEDLKRMAFAVEERSAQQAQAVQEGDMKLSETLYFKKITIQEGMVELFNKLYASIDAHHADAFVQPTKKVHEVHNEANKQVAGVMKQLESLKGRAQGDLKRMDDTLQALKQDAAGASNQFGRFMEDCKRALDLNWKSQDQCLAAVDELEKRIHVLGEERLAIVEKQLRAVDQEKRRNIEVAQFQEFHKQHTTILRSTLQNTEAAEEVTDIIDEMLCNGCNAAESYLRHVESTIEDERKRTHEVRLSHFRNLYLTLGDLQYKKERNMEELDKKIAQAHINQELAMETFNPKAKEFSQMKKDLVKVREEMEQQLHVLQEKSTLHIEAFKPTETALIKSGKQFVHPVAELEHMNRTRQAKLLEYHNLMQSDEHPTTATPVEKEMQAIEEMRTKMQPRKPRSSHGPSTATGGTNAAAGGGGTSGRLSSKKYDDDEI